VQHIKSDFLRNIEQYKRTSGKVIYFHAVLTPLEEENNNQVFLEVAYSCGLI
jgi:hypothetical protein